MSKERIADNNLLWHLPPQFRSNKQVTGAFVQFQKVLSSMLMDHIAEFPKRIAERDKVNNWQRYRRVLTRFALSANVLGMMMTTKMDMMLHLIILALLELEPVVLFPRSLLHTTLERQHFNRLGSHPAEA